MVIIESIIKTNPMGRWYIELIDTSKQSSEDTLRVVCLNIDEYAQKVEIMGVPHNAEIEIAWSTQDDVSPAQINEVRQQIIAYEARINTEQSQESDTEWTPSI